MGRDILIYDVSFYPSSLSVQALHVLSLHSSVQFSRVRLFVTPWTAACQASLPSPTPGVHSNSGPLSQ